MVGVRQIGRYEIVKHLASGGMGQVFLARTRGVGNFERLVVIKTLELGTDEDDEMVAMFLDEARLVGGLHHQFIAPVHEVGLDDDRYFLVMDYIHGESAEAVFRAVDERGLKVPLGFALAVGSAIAAALAYAHDACGPDGAPLEIVHRDVSLSNIMIGYDGGVRLIDFGIAKAVGRSASTQGGALKGNFGYVAPEVILRQEVDRRADVFSLGVVLYELTTARPAFRDRTEFITLERIVSGNLTRPSQFVLDYHPELERVVLKALALDPADRYEDAAAMGRDLEAVAATLALPLGHGAVAELMAALFSARPRRRTARGSQEVQTTATPSEPMLAIGDGTPRFELAHPDTERYECARPTPDPAS